MQERFHTLIKQRLRSEYENNPPLFPWESEVVEYPAEVPEALSTGASARSATSLWGDYVGGLKVAGLLPLPLASSLFEQCQAAICSPVKQGVRLVRAVENLFPEHQEILEPIANMVLIPAYRSDQTTQEALTQELTVVSKDYETALPEQQVALSMLAAQEILGVLTLSLSEQNPTETRGWVLEKGALELTATYRNQTLEVVATLPAEGQMQIHGGDVEKRVMRSQPGQLDISLSKPKSGSYLLELALDGSEQSLNFVIHLDAGSKA